MLVDLLLFFVVIAGCYWFINVIDVVMTKWLGFDEKEKED